MYRKIARLLLYSDLGTNSILVRISDILREWEEGGYDRDDMIGEINAQIKRILDLSTECGFDLNLWQCYLTWVMMTNQNSFTQTCERVGASEGSVNMFAISDFEVFRQLFHYDFAPIEAEDRKSVV